MYWALEKQDSHVHWSLDDTVLGSSGCVASLVEAQVESFAKGRVHCEGQDR